MICSMKNLLLTCGIFIMSGPLTATAGEHTLSTGYAFGQLSANHDRLTDANPDGMNMKYRYEMNDRWGVVGSFTFAGATTDMNAVEWGYYSVMAGPSWRFNEYLSAYYLLGMARTETDINTRTITRTLKKSAFSSALGVMVNPWSNLVLDVGVEYAAFRNFTQGGTDVESLLFITGIGYRF